MIKPKSGKSTLLSLLGCFIVLAALFVSACTKDDSITSSTKKIKSNMEATTGTTMTSDYASLRNANNPYDFVGESHNIILAQSRLILPSYHFIEGDFQNFNNNAISINREAILSGGVFTEYSIENASSDYYTLELDKFFNKDTFNIQTLENYIKNNLQFQTTQRDYLATLQVLTLIHSAYDSDLPLDQLVNKITILESQILNQSWDDQECYARIAISVAKYSANYWLNNYNSSTSSSIVKGYHILGKSSAADKIIVGADVAGAVSGGVLGAKGGLKAGAAFGHPLIGAAAGAVVGGIIKGGISSCMVAGSIDRVFDAWGKVTSGWFD